MRHARTDDSFPQIGERIHRKAEQEDEPKPSQSPLFRNEGGAINSELRTSRVREGNGGEEGDRAAEIRPGRQMGRVSRSHGPPLRLLVLGRRLRWPSLIQYVLSLSLSLSVFMFFFSYLSLCLAAQKTIVGTAMKVNPMNILAFFWLSSFVWFKSDDGASVA